MTQAPSAADMTQDRGELPGTSLAQLLETLDRLTTESQSSEELVWTVRARITVLRQRYRESDQVLSSEQLMRLRAVAAVPDLVADYCAAREEVVRVRFRDEVEALLARHLEDLESTLTRQGYGVKELVQNFDAKPAEIKALFANQLDAIRASELRDRMRLAGLPI